MEDKNRCSRQSNLSGRQKDHQKFDVRHVDRVSGNEEKTNSASPIETYHYFCIFFFKFFCEQESEDNQIHVVDGGINENKITIGINANQTRYLSYNAYFYGTD